MSFDRVLLLVLTAFVLVAGTGCFVAPALFAQQAGFSANPSALTEIRAFYGGLQIGIGLFLVWCLWVPNRTSQGLLLGDLAVGGAGLARMVGILLDQAPTFHASLEPRNRGCHGSPCLCRALKSPPRATCEHRLTRACS